MGVLDFDCAICGAPFKPSALISTLTHQQRRETQQQPQPPSSPHAPRQNGRLRTKSKSTPTLSTTSLSSHLAALHVSSSSSSSPHSTRDAYEEDLHARLAWLRDLRMLAQDPQTGRAYLTGLGNTTDLGWALVGLSDEEDDGDEEGAVTARDLFIARGRYGEGVKLSMSAYSGEDREGDGGGGEEGMASFPLHVRCWELMRKAWRMRRSEAARSRGGRTTSTKGKDDGLDLKVLREVMAGLLQGSRTCLGGMDYRELQPSAGTSLWDDQDQVEAKLPWLYDPVECPSALEAYEILTERQGKGSQSFTRQRSSSPLRKQAVRYHDPFDQLPIELVHSILTHVDANTLLDILSASPSVAGCCDTRFWRNRLRQDMPYLFELNDGVKKLPAYLQEGCDADWERLYRRLLGQAHCREPQSSIEMEDRPEGVASRRRVWECVGQILDLFEARASGTA
ncbi:hypothetical protein KC340_g10023 [Hortaea werneckii]|nr:hypothetical protein KC342_g10328 [Hortaea werneckii]KAI7107855.1 hypothetical protein KC339_g2038 [Hortaea werneckii]KAI7226200.1 hypothetical protein KC365_g9529 [Hortaea werneckii]KAI7312017.1 hypothetical protein KC340_g10023 [Hortaea werneckii]KAI7393574.1 hypothetical protein KC328_g6537 [Hortaea werneckii]